MAELTETGAGGAVRATEDYAASAVPQSEMSEAFTAVGVGTLAAIAIFVQGFPHEVNNLYAGSLAGRNALGVPRLFVNLVSGVIAAAVAYYGVSQGILQSFLEYLGYLAYAMPLIPGIMIADYYLLYRGSYGRRAGEVPLVNWRAFWAFAIGLAVNLYLGLVGDDALWHTLPPIGLVLYLVFSWRQVRDAWSPAGRADDERRFVHAPQAGRPNLTAERAEVGREA
jgi:cytosine permease